MKTRILKNLERIRDLLDEPENWMKRAEAVDAYGNLCEARDPDAVCWCLTGAVYHVTKEDSQEEAETMAQYYAALGYAAMGDTTDQPSQLIAWNDHPNRSHNNLLELLDRAIYKYKEAS